jgi:hypothetical protein
VSFDEPVEGRSSEKIAENGELLLVAGDLCSDEELHELEDEMSGVALSSEGGGPDQRREIAGGWGGESERRREKKGN